MEGEEEGGDRRQKEGDRRSGRALMTFKCPFNKSLYFLSMVRYHMLLEYVYNIFFEGYTYDNHPTVKKAGKMGNAITHQSHSMHLIQEWGGTEDGGNGGSTQVREERRKGRRRGGRLIGREGKERRKRGQRKGREEGDEREGMEGEKERSKENR